MSYPKGFYAQLLTTRTPLRALMNLALAETGTWEGSVLDVGGTRKPLPSYYEYLVRADTCVITAVNIDADARPDIVADAQALPMSAELYDHAWCLNVLEHVPEPLAVLKETYRVLRPRARVAIFTPFFTRIHGHPQDFYRYTDTALERYAVLAGFEIERTRVIGGGPFLCVAAQLQLFIPSVLFVPCAVVARGLDRLFAWYRPRLAVAWPLGYLLMLRKPHSS